MKMSENLVEYIAFLFILFLLLYSNAFAYRINKTAGGANIKWFTPTATYLINPSGVPSNNLSAFQAAMQTAMQTWTDVVTSDFIFVYSGTPTSTACGTYNSANTVCFGQMGQDGTLAWNMVWYDTYSGEIIDSDIKFNTSYSWATDGSRGYYDVQNVGTHELGHSLSLDDLYNTADSEKTMYGYAADGETKKRTLEQDDMDGITFLYPAIIGSDPVRILRTLEYLSTIQYAYNACVDGDIIQCQTSDFNEFNGNRDISVTLEGGYDPDFTSNLNNYSTINGSMTISNGTVTVENIVIQ